MEIAFKKRKDKSGFAKAWVLHRKRAAFNIQLILENEEKSKLVQTD